MSNFTFLTAEQCFGNKKLDILKKRGTKAAITDFSILLGGVVGNCHIDGDHTLEGRTGYYWTKSDNGEFYTCVANMHGFWDYEDAVLRGGGARPVLPFSSIDQIPTNGESGTPKRAKDGVLEVEYGYYPQKAVSRDMQERLERAFEVDGLLKTGKQYTTDSRKYSECEVFSPKQHEEFGLDGKRYVRVKANSRFRGDEFKLSNGESYREGDLVWVEVAPVKWLVDKKSRMMITEKLIFAGVQFNKKTTYNTRDFDKTEIKTFMDRYLSKDLIPSRDIAEQAKSEKKDSREHSGDEAKGIIDKGISAFKKIFGSYKEYLTREDIEKDDKTKE